MRQYPEVERGGQAPMSDPKELSSLQLSLLQQIVQQRRQTYLVEALQVWRRISVEQFFSNFPPPSKSEPRNFRS